jgi:hypothetical protein
MPQATSHQPRPVIAEPQSKKQKVEISTPDYNPAKSERFKPANVKGKHWEWFVKHNEAPGFAFCLLCEKVKKNVWIGLPQRTTQNMRHHLTSEHKIVLDSPTPVKTTLRQSMLPVTQVMPLDKSRADRKLALAIVVENIPILFSDSPMMISYSQYISSGRYTPSGRTAITSHISILAEEMKANVMKALQEIDSIALTTDGGCYYASKKFVALTGHYITKKWELQSVTLAVKFMAARSTAEELSFLMATLIDEWGIRGAVSGVVTDNGANFCAATKLLKEREVVSDSIRCACHSIQLCVNKAVRESQDLKAWLDKIRCVVSLIKNSSNNYQVYAASQKARKLIYPEYKPTKLQPDNVTRWNSTYTMICSLLANREAINSSLSQIDETMAFSGKEWDNMKGLRDLLEPCKVATKSLEAEKYPTLGSVVPVTALALKFTRAAEINPEMKDIKSALVSELELQFGSAPIPVLLASVLDPRWKKLTFLSKKNKDALLVALRSRVGIAIPKPQAEKEPEAKTFDEKFQRELDEGASDNEEDVAAPFDEVTSYMATPRCERQESPLEWWSRHESLFPNVAMAAKKFLCIPASNAPSERVFSAVELLARPNRNKFDPNRMEELVMLRRNIHFVEP